MSRRGNCLTRRSRSIRTTRPHIRAWFRCACDGSARDGPRMRCPTARWRQARHSIDMIKQPVMQGFDDGSTSLVPDSSSVFGRLSAYLCFHRVERGDTRQHLGHERRLSRRVELEEVAPHVRPAERQSDRLIGTLAGQTLEAAISVHLQHVIETHEVFGGAGILAVLAYTRPRKTDNVRCRRPDFRYLGPVNMRMETS